MRDWRCDARVGGSGGGSTCTFAVLKRCWSGIYRYWDTEAGAR